MYMSNLDAKGFLGTDELSALLNHNALVRTTEIGTCDTGKYAVTQVLWLLQWERGNSRLLFLLVETGLRYMIGIFGVATTYQLMSVLMNEMPMVVVSSHPNR